MRETLQACCLIGLVFASPAVAQNAAPGEMQAPRLSAADVDWSAVRAALADLEPLKSQADVLTQLNSAIAKVLPKIAASPVPVLLPFDTAAYLHDTALGAAGDAGKYLSGFSAATLFFPGPSGYDAVAVVAAAGCAGPRSHLRPSRERADFRLGAALRARRFRRCRRNRGAAARRPISRHPPRADREPSALQLRALRRALFRLDRMFRRREQFAPAVVPRGGQGRHALPQSPQRRRRRAAGQSGEPCAAADRAAGTGVAGLHLLRAGRHLARHRLARPEAAAPIPPSMPKSAFPWRKRPLTPTRNRS